MTRQAKWRVQADQQTVRTCSRPDQALYTALRIADGRMANAKPATIEGAGEFTGSWTVAPYREELRRGVEILNAESRRVALIVDGSLSSMLEWLGRAHLFRVLVRPSADYAVRIILSFG